MTMGTHNLPPASEWRHGDVCTVFDDDPSKNMRRTGEDAHEKILPVGQEISFESDLFVGKMLMRSKGIKSDNPEVDAKYFEGKKRQGQFVLQGQFKKSIPLNELKIGNIYDEPFPGLPPKWVFKPMIAFFSALRPGMEMDLHAKNPLTLFPLGSCQTLRVDKPGTEPDIVKEFVIKEETSLLLPKDKYRDPKKRIKMLCNNEKAKRFSVEPGLVYTIELYDDLVDLGAWTMKVGFGIKISLDEATKGQPFGNALVRWNGKDPTEWVYRIQIHHKDASKEETSES